MCQGTCPTCGYVMRIMTFTSSGYCFCDRVATVTHFVKESRVCHEGVVALGEKKKESLWEWVWAFLTFFAIILVVILIDLYKKS